MERQQGEILVVSPERGLAEALKPQLAQHGLNVRQVQECNFLRDQPNGEHAALVVVDLQLPASGWLEVCREVRSGPEVALIALLPWPDPDLTTAVLDLGADDCLASPISPRELTLRIRAVLRRTGNY